MIAKLTKSLCGSAAIAALGAMIAAAPAATGLCEARAEVIGQRAFYAQPWLPAAHAQLQSHLRTHA